MVLVIRNTMFYTTDLQEEDGVNPEEPKQTPNSESFDSIAVRSSSSSLGFCDLCRGLPAHSVREQAFNIEARRTWRAAEGPMQKEAETRISLQDRDARKNLVERRHLFLVGFFRDPIGHCQDFVAGLGHHEADRCRAELFVVPVP